MTTGIHLPAINRTVSIGAYCAAISKAKANPDAMFPHGLTTWWPTSGRAIVGQFRLEMNRRITDARPIRKGAA